MGLRQAILGFLTADDMTGYEFAKAFDGSVGNIWAAPHSQIYRELRKMEEEGLVRGRAVARGTAEKREYAITDEGVARLMEWLETPLPFPPERDAHRLQALYLDMISPAAARQRFEEHLHYFERRLLHWTGTRDAITARRLPILRQRLEHRDPSEHDAIVEYKAHAFDGLVAQAKSEIAWARRGLALVDRLEAE